VFCAAIGASPNWASGQCESTATTMFLIRNYVPNWTTTPPAPTIAPTTAPIASTVTETAQSHL